MKKTTLDIKKVEYFNIIVEGHAAEGFKLLSVFADAGVNLLAFKAVPAGHNRTQFTLFPDDSSKMNKGARNAGLKLDGPYSAILVKGNGDEPGECAMVHERVAQAGINVTESCGIADIKDSYGIILYMRQEDCGKAMAALKM